MLAFVSYICMFLVLFQWEAVCLFSSIKVIIFLLLSIGSRAVKLTVKCPKIGSRAVKLTVKCPKNGLCRCGRLADMKRQK